MTHGISNSLYCLALACSSDLPPVKYRKKVYVPGATIPYRDLPEEDAERRPMPHEVEVYSFPQTWGSTALGFGGVGGQAMTVAQTTVCIYGNSAAVYFNIGFAYLVDKIQDGFMTDVRNHDMASRSEAMKYRPAK